MSSPVLWLIVCVQLVAARPAQPHPQSGSAPSTPPTTLPAGSTEVSPEQKQKAITQVLEREVQAALNEVFRQFFGDSLGQTISDLHSDLVKSAQTVKGGSRVERAADDEYEFPEGGEDSLAVITSEVRPEEESRALVEKLRVGSQLTQRLADNNTHTSSKVSQGHRPTDLSLDDLVTDLAADLWAQRTVQGQGKAVSNLVHLQAVLENDVKHGDITFETKDKILGVLHKAVYGETPLSKLPQTDRHT